MTVVSSANTISSDRELMRLLRVLKTEKGIFFDSALRTAETQPSFLFLHPVRIIEFYQGQDPDALFRTIEHYVREGFWIAGYFTYEFGYCLEPVLQPLAISRHSEIPLVWLGVFNEPQEIIHDLRSSKTPMHAGEDVCSSGMFSMEQDEYAGAIERIKELLAEGETYQVNFTMRYRFLCEREPAVVYAALRLRQPTAYSSFCHDGCRTILSFSPELFFKIRDNQITLRPMKGTCPRGRTDEEDQKNIHLLQGDAKNRAENAMIVDLLRNDLGKIAVPGSIRVENIFSVEVYQTLFQMTSTVCGELKKEIAVGDIFRALFPSGSVTGAPKINTMKIIQEIEKDYRGVYAGAIGYIEPSGNMLFNVAIRTLVLRGENVEYGVGSGIVADSMLEKEYEECVLKTKFLHAP